MEKDKEWKGDRVVQGIAEPGLERNAASKLYTRGYESSFGTLC